MVEFCGAKSLSTAESAKRAAADQPPVSSAPIATYFGNTKQCEYAVSYTFDNSRRTVVAPHLSTKVESTISKAGGGAVNEERGIVEGEGPLACKRNE